MINLLKAAYFLFFLFPIFSFGLFMFVIIFFFGDQATKIGFIPSLVIFSISFLLVYFIKKAHKI